jgi:dihydroxyacetone kinase-like protein
MKTLTAAQAKAMMIDVAKTIVDAKEALCQADRNIGDGDHGVGMATGFEAAGEALQSQEFSDVYQVFSTVGRTMIKTMGGASGIIFGLLFYAGSKNAAPQEELTVAGFSELFAKALAEIQAKGQAKVGDKTVVDALSPMVDALKECAAQDLSFPETLAKASQAAEEGKEASRNYIAKFGKAKTLGERALGFPDAGAVSLTLIMSSMLEWVKMNMQ